MSQIFKNMKRRCTIRWHKYTGRIQTTNIFTSPTEWSTICNKTSNLLMHNYSVQNCVKYNILLRYKYCLHWLLPPWSFFTADSERESLGMYRFFTTPLSTLISSCSLNHHLYADNTQLFLSFLPTHFDSSIDRLHNALDQISPGWLQIF